MALIQLSRWDEAVAWCRTLRGDATHPVSLVDMEAYALIKLGRAEEARGLLRAIPMDLADRQSDLVRLLAEALYQTGDDRGFRTTLLMYLQLHQGDPARYLEMLAFCAGKPALRKEFPGALRAYYHRFGKQEDALAQLAGFLLSEHMTAELEELLAQVKAQGFSTQGAETALVESLLYDGRLAEAETLLRALPVPPEKTLPGFRLALLRRTLTCLQPGGQGASAPLLEFLGRRRLPLSDSLGLAELLVRHGRPDPAEQILKLARQSYPHSPRVAERLATLQREHTAGQYAAGLLSDRP